MLGTQDVMLEVGIIMLVAFIGAALASRFKQSVIVGYIIVGILIGPNIAFEVFGVEYQGLISDITFIEYMARIGLIMLMFFVGLEFSISKLKKTKGPSLILAFVDVGVNMFLGVLLGMALGWPLVDTLFLAGVMAMSSAAITGKSLMELNKFSSPETEFLLGMVVMESFVAMVLLTIIGGLSVKIGDVGISASNLLGMLVGFLAFFVFFTFLALFVIPRSARYLQKVKSDELFVLFALGMVFLSSALAEACGVPAIIGAFFLGMVFAETKLAERFDSRLTSFRDVFVAIFFVFFGMLIDPAMFADIIIIVIVAVPLAIIGEIFFTGAISYLLGFSSRAATSMGASMCGRGAESIMYASVGSNAAGVVKGAEINPFAGLFCFIMSVITPILMRFSDPISRGLSKMLPSYAKQGGAIMSRTMGKVLLPNSLKLFKRGKRIELGLIAYFMSLITVAVTAGIYHIGAFVVALALTVWTLYMFESELTPVVRSINYENLGANGRGSQQISRFISSFISVSLLAMLLVAFLFQYAWWLTVLVIVAYFFVMLAIMRHYSRVIRSPIMSTTFRPQKSSWKFESPILVPFPSVSLDDVKVEASKLSSPMVKKIGPSEELGEHDKWKYL